MNVPKLRFKEFTDEWNYTCLSEISAEITYGMNSASTEFDGLNKYIRITDIDDETGNFKPSNLVSPLNKPEDKFLVKKDDILFARTGASTGKTYLYNIKDGKLYFAGFLIKAHIVNHNSNFIFQQTKLEKYKKWVKLTSMRSGQPGINSEEYGKCVFSITSLSEENKIAQFLSLLDKKIELQTKKIEALKLFKKGLNQRMFSKIGKMKSISQYVEEYINKTIVNNQYPILSSTFNGIVIQNEYFNKQAASSKNIGYKIVPRNYITYRSMSDTGEFHFNIQDKVDIGIVSPAYPVFRINNINANYFLNYINESYDFKMQIISIKEGGTRYALGFNKFKKLKIKIIDDDEFYGDFIKKLNEYLLLEDKKLDDLNKLKKGLLQNMFV